VSKIIRLEAEAFKRLRAVEITPDGTLVQIRGLNGAGKSSCLDAIAAALGGEKLCPEVPIHRGAEKARVLVELDDGIIVERKWTAAGTRLEVRTKDGLKYAGPQKILDGLVGRLTFDPLAFMREQPAKQAEVLRQLVGIDLSALDAKRRAAFDARTDANRRVAAAKARLAATPEVDAPGRPEDAGALLQEHQSRVAEASAQDAKRRELTEAREDFKRYERHVAETNARIAKLEEQLAQERAVLAADLRAIETCRNRGLALKAEVDALVPPNLTEIPERLKEVEATNERVRAKKARAGLAAELSAAEAEAAKLTTAIEAVDAEKAAALEQAAFPVPGLAFGELGVTLNGLPLEQASSAEQLRVSVAMGLALNPKLKVLLVRDASLLDERSLALVAGMAEKAGAQVWLEVVAAGGAGIVIEDGMVAAAAAAAGGVAHAG
jgi:hypothetical protein